MLLNIIFGKGTRQIPSRIGKNTNKYKQSCLGSKWNQPRSRNILFSWPWNLFPLQVKWGRGVGQMRPWTKKRTKFTSAKQISVIKEQDHCEAKFLNLKMEKFKFKWNKEPFIGPVMTKNRLKVGQQKLDARVKMERQADVSAVKILLWLELYPNSYKTFQKCESNTPAWYAGMRADLDSWVERCLPKDQRPPATQVLQREWTSRGPRRCVQGWVWLFNIAAWSTGDIYEWGTPSGREKVLTDREGIFGCFHWQRA